MFRVHFKSFSIFLSCGWCSCWVTICRAQGKWSGNICQPQNRCFLWRDYWKYYKEWFFNCRPPPSVQYRNPRMPRSQPELLFHDILHLKKPLVDSLAVNHFGTEQEKGWGWGLKNYPVQRYKHIRLYTQTKIHIFASTIHIHLYLNL